METTNEIIKRVIENTFASLIQTPTVKVNDDDGLRIAYPCYRNGQTRCTASLISEQELKQAFIYFLQKETNLYYSVETPTRKLYRFSGDDNVPRVCEDGEEGQSANIDLSIYESLSQVESGTPFANIEFKSGNPEPKDIQKDLLKLYREPARFGFLLHILGSSNEETWNSLSKKYLCKNLADNSENEVAVYVYSMSEQRRIEIFPDGTMK